MIFGLDLMGEGAANDYHGIVDLANTEICTLESLDAEANLTNWAEDYGPTLDEYMKKKLLEIRTISELGEHTFCVGHKKVG